MGKSKLPTCGTCTPTCAYKKRCDVPFEPEPSTANMYVDIATGQMYCKSFYVSNKFNRVTNSLYNFDGCVGLNDGVPTAVWNDAASAPFTNYQVPYVLQEMSGNTKSNQMILVSQIYDGTSDQSAVIAPALGETTNTAVLADSSDRFAKGVISLYPVSASKGDTGTMVSMFKINNQGDVCMRVTVQAVDLVVNGTTGKYTKVLAVEDISNPCCKTPLNFTTFRVSPLGGDPATDTPVFMTFAKNNCCEFQIGFYHGVASDAEPGSVFPPPADEDGNVEEIEWPSYMFVTARGVGCPLNEGQKLVNMFASTVSNQIFAAQTATLGGAVIVDLLRGATPITPGQMTSSEKATLVTAMSKSVVDAWVDGVAKINALLEQIAPPV